LVIGKYANKVKRQDFLNYIEAYFICLDLTDRTFQHGIINYFIEFYFKRVKRQELPGSILKDKTASFRFQSL